MAITEFHHFFGLPRHLVTQMRVCWLLALAVCVSMALLGARDVNARSAYISLEDIHPDRLSKIFLSAYERKPKNFESLLALDGMGAKTLRALSLISELVYDTPASLRDPVSYSFAHGGKDGYPYPVDKQTYDKSIQFLTQALEKARIGDKEKLEAFRRLRTWQ